MFFIDSKKNVFFFLLCIDNTKNIIATETFLDNKKTIEKKKEKEIV